MSTKRQRGKRRAAHNQFVNKVRAALADVERTRRQQRRKNTPEFVIMQMRKRNFVPDGKGGWITVEKEESK